MPKINMPTINRNELSDRIRQIGLDMDTEDEYGRIADLVLNSRNGCIRASKPKITDDDDTGKTAYVWRMVVFMVSRKGPHQCMPVCADFDLPARDENGRWSCDGARKMSKELDRLVDAFVDCVAINQQYGVLRWGRALGYL